MNRNFTFKSLTLACIMILFLNKSFAQTPNLQDVTSSGNTTTNTIRLNRLAEPDVLGSRFLIIGRNNVESLNMNNVYLFGLGNKLTANNLTHISMLGINNTSASVGVSLFGQNNTVVAGVGSTGVGIQNTFSGLANESVGIGTYNTISSNQGNAFGRNNNISGEKAQAFGLDNIISGKRGIALGIESTVAGENGSAVGYRNTASSKSASAMGKDNIASGEMSIAVGYANNASGKSSSALGKDNISSGEQSVAFGKGSQALGYKSIALGVASVATATNSVAIGNVSNDIATSLKIGPKLTSYLFINETGNVGIGTTDPKGYKLAVAGSIVAEEIKVKLQSAWPDYVFEKSYDLTSLQETEKYIKENKHLPEMPSANLVKDNGLNLGEMNALLLKKVEELTLHLIEQNKIQTDLVCKQNSLINEVQGLKTELDKIKGK